MRYFLAGGAVRDLLLGRRPTEFDIVFDGTFEEMARLREHARRVGKTAVTYIVDGHDYAPLAGTISEDLLARDCTINALLLEDSGILHALPQTFADLKNGVIRHASPESFSRDPVRLLRAARFSATLPGFSIAAETVSVMRDIAGKKAFQRIAAERVGKECMKAMAGHTPGNFIRALSASGALAPWFAPLEIGNAVPAGPDRYHGNDTVLEHTLAVMDAVAAMDIPQDDKSLASWMALCHDLGKLTTDPAMLPRHIGHELRGEKLAVALAQRLRLPKLWEKAGRFAASLHMKAGQYPVLRPGTRVDFLHTLAASRLAAPFAAMVAADSGDAAIREMLLRDMKTILTVALPEKWRNKGPESAKELRRLRIRALKQASAG